MSGGEWVYSLFLLLASQDCHGCFSCSYYHNHYSNLSSTENNGLYLRHYHFVMWLLVFMTCIEDAFGYATGYIISLKTMPLRLAV